MMKTNMQAWNKTFTKYLSVRKTARADVIHEKARDFAFKAFQFLPPTERQRIESDMAKDNMLLKITVRRLQAKGVNLKGLPPVKLRRKKGQTGAPRMISGADKIIQDYAKKLLRSKIRSRGYHRVAFLLLAQKLGQSGKTTINPKSTLMKSSVQQQHTPSKDVYTLNAWARGMDCPSTDEARDKALAAMEAKMKAFIAQRLAQAAKAAGFQ